MRIAFLSDIHGNLPALEAVLADAHAEGVDAFAAAGDMTSGVWPEEVVTRILGIGQWVIAGNHEDYYLRYDRGTAPEDWGAGPQWAGIRWCYGCLSRKTLDALGALPQQTTLSVEGLQPIRLLHGSPQGIADRLYPDRNPAALAHFRRAGFLKTPEPPPLSLAVAGVAEPVVVCGHTHIPWLQTEGTRLIANAGAVGGALNGDWRAQYLILTSSDPGPAGGRATWRAEHRAVPYDINRVRERFIRSGYLAEAGAFARAMLLNIETGLNWPGALLRHVDRYARDRGWDGVGLISDELWVAGVATFAWA
jgi:predicted phosphodiesterase